MNQVPRRPAQGHRRLAISARRLARTASPRPSTVAARRRDGSSAVAIVRLRQPRGGTPFVLATFGPPDPAPTAWHDVATRYRLTPPAVEVRRALARGSRNSGIVRRVRVCSERAYGDQSVRNDARQSQLQASGKFRHEWIVMGASEGTNKCFERLDRRLHQHGYYATPKPSEPDRRPRSGIRQNPP